MEIVTLFITTRQIPTLKCIKDPIIWLDKNQVTGEKIEFKAFEGKIYNMFVTNNSMIITRKDSIHYDQIKGNQINGLFKNNELNILDVTKNGQAIYYSSEEKDSLINEINFISCESMKLHMKENKIEKYNSILNRMVKLFLLKMMGKIFI